MVVVSKHRVEVVFRRWHHSVDRTREMLVLKVDLAVCSVPAFQQQGVRRET